MITNKSTKYNDKGEFWHDGRRVIFQRIWGGLSFKGTNLFSVIVGEENFFSTMHFYILLEMETEVNDSIIDLIQASARYTSLYRVDRWLGRLDTNISETLAVSNKSMYNSGIKGLSVMDVPRISEYITEGVGLIQNLVKPSEKRLHFFSESMIPSELVSLPTNKVKAEDHPRTTALSCVLWGFLRYGHENVDSSMLIPSPEAAY